jgi:hypothetical protein
MEGSFYAPEDVETIPASAFSGGIATALLSVSVLSTTPQYPSYLLYCDFDLGVTL